MEGQMTKIQMADEIDIIRKRLIEMGEVVEEFKGFDFAEKKRDDEWKKVNPMAPHKLKQAKARKKKRKRGGPR